jgi:hypothetical protein
MLILHSRAMHPESCNRVCTPSRILMCVNPISCRRQNSLQPVDGRTRMNPSFACSERESIDLVTRNMVLIMSWHE